MKPYLFSLGAGLLVGAVYALLNVRSPAPPVIALLGLLGILMGEQAVSHAQRLIGRKPIALGATPQPSEQAVPPEPRRPGALDSK